MKTCEIDDNGDVRQHMHGIVCTQMCHTCLSMHAMHAGLDMLYLRTHVIQNDAIMFEHANLCLCMYLSLHATDFVRTLRSLHVFAHVNVHSSNKWVWKCIYIYKQV
jgi:hypothetical protein